MRKTVLCVVLGILCSEVRALDIRVNSKPIHDTPPTLVNEIANARLEIAGANEDAVHILHLWGTPYNMGVAQGRLFKHEISEHLPTVVRAMIDAGKISVSVLDDVERATKPFWPRHLHEELRGISDGSGIDLKMLIRCNLVGEVSERHCSLFGAEGEATAGGHLLQLRSLDYAVRAGIQRYPVVTIYHPIEGHAFANIGWAGVIGCVSGISDVPLAISQIGAGYDARNDSFKGVPFMFMLRDILQFDNSLEEAITRIEKGPRTTSLLYAVGDGKQGIVRGLQTSRSLCRVFDPDNLEPLVPTHPRIKNIVYWGMSWNVPAYNKALHDMLVKHYGRISPEVTVREILPSVKTGNLQVVVYDLTDNVIWTANAAAYSGNEKPPLDAYDRAYVKLDMKALFAVRKPEVQE